MDINTMYKKNLFRVFYGAILFVALIGLCSCKSKTSETITPKPQVTSATAKPPKIVLDKVPDYILNRGIIIRGEKVENGRGYYIKAPDKDITWYYDYVCDCNLSEETSEEEFSKFLERFSFYDETPYEYGDGAFLHPDDGESSSTSIQIRWAWNYSGDLSKGTVYYESDNGVNRPVFFDAEGKYILTNEGYIPDEVLLAFLEPLMVKVDIETSNDNEVFSSEDTDVISICVGAMHNLSATSVNMDANELISNNEYIHISFTTDKDRIHEYYVVNQQYLVDGDIVYELSNASDFVKTMENDVLNTTNSIKDDGGLKGVETDVQNGDFD